MMETRLGVITCDKCQKPMTKGQHVITITEGSITKSNAALIFDGSCVRYACHLNCWDGVEEIGVNYTIPHKASGILCGRAHFTGKF